MKKHIALFLIFLIVPIISFGQEKPDMNDVPRTPPVWEKEFEKAACSNYVEAITEAFNDPNVFIGVLEKPKLLPNSVPATILTSGEILEELPGYWEAMMRTGLIQLRCVKSIKGKFAEPVVFVIPPPLMRTLHDTRIPVFIPFSETKWVLALQKTSDEYRIARLGTDIKKYKFFNDETVFSLFHWGHGALCLKWPEKQKEPECLVKVSEGIVKDLEAIGQAMPHIQKKKLEPVDIAALEKTKHDLKTAHAKSIFDRLMQKRQEQEKAR